MQYSNLKNETDQEEGRPKVAKKLNINMSTEDLLKKKESYWFLALIITLIIIGSIIFYCAHTGGRERIGVPSLDIRLSHESQ